MKKLSVLILSIVIMLSVALIGCGSSTGTSNTGGKQLTKEEFVQMYSDADKFKGSKVDFYGRVFAVEKDDKGTYLQVFADSKNSDQNTLVGIKDPKLDVKEDDIVHITGTVKGKESGQNALGGKVTAPVIEADKIEKSDYATAFAPAKKTITPNAQQDQKGFVINVSKVEFAESETRIYLSVTNNMKNKINFYTHNAKVTQDGKQYEPQDSFEANYPNMQSEILPGVKSEGIVVFPKLDEAKEAKLILEGYSDDYNIKIEPFTFDIK